jgi:hypothetical protein
MAVDLDAYRKQSRETWGQMATGWEDRRNWLMAITGPINNWLVDKADAQPGQTILEIAAGTGDLGFHVAERAGEESRVISTDFTSRACLRRRSTRCPMMNGRRHARRSWRTLRSSATARVPTPFPGRRGACSYADQSKAWLAAVRQGACSGAWWAGTYLTTIESAVPSTNDCPLAEAVAIATAAQPPRRSRD